MTDDPSQDDGRANERTAAPQAFTILLPDGATCDPATKALAERYIGAAGGDPVLAVLLACQDVLVLQGAASHGMMHGRKLVIDQS